MGSVDQKNINTNSLPNDNRQFFAWQDPNAAEQQRKEETKDIKPYWHPLDTNGVLIPKNPGGAEGLKILLDAEGYKVMQKVNIKVIDYKSRF